MPRSSDPIRHRHRAPPPQIGREREQAYLRAILDEAFAGHGDTVLVGGEAGIGKTTLVSTLASEALDRGALVLAGGCSDLTTTPAFGPWIEITRSYPTDPDLPPLPDQFKAGNEMASIDSEAALFDLFNRFLLRVTEKQPLVLILEDLHWADPASLGLLRSVARALRERPALLIGTYRDDEPLSEHPFFQLLPSLVRETYCQRLVLHRLDHAAIRELIREHYHLTLEDENRLVVYVVGLAEGNPFFTLELLYSFAEERLLIPGDDGWWLGDLSAVQVPPLVQQIVRTRLIALDDNARNLLDLTAVVGQEVALDVLQQQFDGTPAELDAALQQVLDRRLGTFQHGQQMFRISHALVRQTIYEAIPPLRRHGLHREIAETLMQNRYADVEAVANHFFHAVDARGIDWLLRAAERAQTLFAAETVIARCDQARHLASITGVEIPSMVYRLQGRALETIGDFTGAREAHELALETARDLADTRAAWRACLDLGNLWASRDYEQARGYLERALELAKEIGVPAFLGQSLNRLGNWYVNAEQLADGVQYHQEALNIFERVGDQAGIAATLDLLGMAHHVAGDVDHAAIYYRRAIPLLSALDDRRTLVTSLIVSTTTVPSMMPLMHPVPVFPAATDTVAERFDIIDETINITRDIGWRAGEAFSLALGSHTAQVLGSYNRALAQGWQAITIASEIDHHQWLAAALTAFGDTLLDLLSVERAVELLERAHIVGQGTSSRFLTEYTTVLLAASYIARNELDRAEALIRPRFDITQLRESLRQRDYCFVLVQLEIARKNASDALTLLDHLQDAMPGTDGPLSPNLRKLRADALMAAQRYPEAEPILNEALQRAEALGFRPLVWRILVSQHKCYLAQGSLDRAAEVRQAALHTIDELVSGLDDNDLREHFLTEARAQLPAQLPFRADRFMGPGVAALTPREREVLTLIAQGMTDAAAADQLYISPRTVSQHLRSIYTKLDVANRASAVRVAIEHDLLGRPPHHL